MTAKTTPAQLVARLRSSVRLSHTGCLEWTEARDTKGYGRIAFEGKWQHAHRLSYEFLVAPIPEGLCIMHRCDNPCCINPDHLTPGTKADNARDKVMKGRQRRHHGDNNPNARLTADAVRAIRESKEMGITLASLYGVTPTSISDARRGKTWSHL